MKKTVTAFGAVIGLAMLGACAPSAYDDYGYNDRPYYGGSQVYYGPDYYADPTYRGGYYGGGGVYVAPRDPDRGGYRRGDRDGRRDNVHNDDRGNNDGRGYRDRDGQNYQNNNQNNQPRPQQSQQQWQPQPGVSPRAQIFGGGNAPPPAASAPAPVGPGGWYGHQGRNPNDPNNTD